MTLPIPEGVSLDDQVDVDIEVDEKAVTVTSTVAGIEILVYTPFEDEDKLAFALEVLPAIIINAYRALDQREEEGS